MRNHEAQRTSHAIQVKCQRAPFESADALDAPSPLRTRCVVASLQCATPRVLALAEALQTASFFVVLYGVRRDIKKQPELANKGRVIHLARRLLLGWG